MANNKLANKVKATAGVKGFMTKRGHQEDQRVLANQRLQQLIRTIEVLMQARDLESIMGVVCSAARDLVSADGTTFVLREGDQCFYADENALRPLWKGGRFPMSLCISGWVMMNQQPAVIEDIYADARIPMSAYRPTFVKSLVMVPIRSQNPLGAIGNYWAHPHSPTPEEVQLLQSLADMTAIIMEKVRLFDEQQQRLVERELAEHALLQKGHLLSESQRMAHIGSWLWHQKNPIIWTDEMYRIYGVSPETFTPTVESLVELIHPDDRPAMQESIRAYIAGENPGELEFRCVWPDGTIHWIRRCGELIYDAESKTTVMAGTSQDITKSKESEQALQASVAEKVVLMREIHHRVKNNLQMMSAMLELQSGYVTDKKSLGYFKNSQLRIQTIATLHEQLYQNANVSQIDFAYYLRTLVDNLREQYNGQTSNVSIQFDIQLCTLSMDTAIPLGLVVTELVSNVFKHAFPQNRAGELRIVLRSEGNDYGPLVLEVVDNGVGTPAELRQQRGNSFGLELVRLMVEKQLDGKLTIESTSQGTYVVCEIGKEI